MQALFIIWFEPIPFNTKAGTKIAPFCEIVNTFPTTMSTVKKRNFYDSSMEEDTFREENERYIENETSSFESSPDHQVGE